jgi:nucleoside phosphorylase
LGGKEDQSTALDTARVAEALASLHADETGWGQMSQKPDRGTDLLFESDYHHASIDSSCQDCEPARLIHRPPRIRDEIPVVHYGRIAQTANVVKYGHTREKLRKQFDVLSFELGLGPALTGLRKRAKIVAIQGISDYADSHKSKIWRSYAAAAAAATAKEYLGTLQNSPKLTLPDIPSRFLCFLVLLSLSEA